MIRILKHMPRSGSVVIAKITTVDKETQIHDCMLLEYGNLPGKIMRADTNNRETRKEFINIKVGMIVLLICQEDPTTDALFVAVSYPTLDKETIVKYKNNYNSIMRIINTLTMMLYVQLNANSKECRPDEILQNNDNIRKGVQKMFNEIFETFGSTDELIEAFFGDTLKLHSVAKTWQKCMLIDNFHNKLLLKFPLPTESVTIRYEYVNIHCDSITQIKNSFAKIEQIIHKYDAKTSVKIVIDTAPFYRLYIKEIETDDLSKYVSELREELFSEKHFDGIFEMFKFESEELHTTRKIEHSNE